MPAHGQVEKAVRSLECENVLTLERQSRSQARVSRSRQFEVRLDDVDPAYSRLRKQLGESRGNLSCSASRIEDLRFRRKCVAHEQRSLLRPDRAGLRTQVPHHGLVGHLFGLRIEIGHACWFRLELSASPPRKELSAA